MRFKGCEKVLDVGSGTGNVISKTNANLRVATDLSPEMLLQLREKDQSVMLVAAAAECLPSPMAHSTSSPSTRHCTISPTCPRWRRCGEWCGRAGHSLLLDHEEAFHEGGWRATVYDAIRVPLSALAEVWYWRRPAAEPYSAYREVHWPYSGGLGPIDFFLTDGGHPDPDEIEAELTRRAWRPAATTTSFSHYRCRPTGSGRRTTHAAGSGSVTSPLRRDRRR